MFQLSWKGVVISKLDIDFHIKRGDLLSNMQYSMFAICSPVYKWLSVKCSNPEYGQ